MDEANLWIFTDIMPPPYDMSDADNALYPHDPARGYFRHLWHPPTDLYPHFLFPPKTTTSTARNSHFNSLEHEQSTGNGETKVPPHFMCKESTTY